MQWLVDVLSTLLNAILNLGDIGIWLFSGLLQLARMMDDAVSILSTALKFFPFEIYTAITAVFGGLVVLRILGRS